MRKVTLLLLSIFVSISAFSHGQEGGEGGPPPNDWVFTVEKLNGTTRNEIWYYHPETGEVTFKSQTYDWATDSWAQNGVPIPRGLGYSVNGVQETKTIEAVAYGNVRVHAQYVGEGPAPNQVGIRIANVAYLNGGEGAYSGSIENGLGSEEVWTDGLIFGANTPDKHLRYLKVDANGHGQLDLHVNVEVEVTGELSTTCRAVPVAFEVVEDKRIVNIHSLDGIVTFWKTGTRATSPSVATFEYPFSNFTLEHDFDYYETSRIIAPIEYGGLYTNKQSVDIGLPKSFEYFEDPSPHDHWLSVEGYAYWGLRPPNVLGGTYAFNLPHPGQYSSGHLGIDNGEISWFKNCTTKLLMPFDCWDRLMPWDSWLWVEEHAMDADDSQTYLFDVVFSDGVKGKSVREVQFHMPEEPIEYSEVASPEETFDIRLPQSDIPVVPSQDTEDIWVKAGVSSTLFWEEGSREWLTGPIGGLQAGQTAANIGQELSSNTIVAAAIAALASGLGFAVGYLEQWQHTQSRDEPFDEFQAEDNVSSEQDFLADPRGFNWRLSSRPAPAVQAITTHCYGNDGYAGTSYRFRYKFEPAIMAWRILIVKRKIINP